MNYFHISYFIHETINFKLNGMQIIHQDPNLTFDVAFEITTNTYSDRRLF